MWHFCIATFPRIVILKYLPQKTYHRYIKETELKTKRQTQDQQEILHDTIIPYIRHFKMQKKMSILAL